MSWQDVQGHYVERDDDPQPGRTIPENPTPGRRYMQAARRGSWDVYDWQEAACDHCCRRDMADQQDCPRCKGTGTEGYMEPERIAADMFEEDARLLVFGGELLAAAGEAIRSLDLASDDPTGRTYPLYVKLREALANVKGG